MLNFLKKHTYKLGYKRGYCAGNAAKNYITKAEPYNKGVKDSLNGAYVALEKRQADSMTTAGVVAAIAKLYK